MLNKIGSFTTKLLLMLIICISYLHSQDNIKWTRVIHDSQGRPLYSGGMTQSSPVFVDIDADGDQDLFVGTRCLLSEAEGYEGVIWFFRNTGTAEEPQWYLESQFYEQITGYSVYPIAFDFADIDADGDYDLFVGMGNYIKFYRNDGDSNQPIMNFITDTYENIEIDQTVHFCAPKFVDIDGDLDLDLFIGLGSWYVFYFENIGTLNNAEFKLVSENYFGKVEGAYIRVFFIDIDNDLDYDAFIGSSGYNLLFLKNIGDSENAEFEIITENYNDIDEYESAPSLIDIDADSDFDLFVGNNIGQINFYRNDGSPEEPEWTFVTETFATLDLGFMSSPSFFDNDNNGVLDLFISQDISQTAIEWGESIWLFENTGSPKEPIWELVTTCYDSISIFDMSGPEFCDIDDDKDKDMFFGDYYGRVWFYRNDGDSSGIVWTLVDSEFVYPDWEHGNVFSDPAFVDIDNDGDYDLFVQYRDGIVGNYITNTFYRNTGTPEAYNFEFEYVGYGFFGSPSFYDNDNDGDYDYFSGWYYDNSLLYFENIGTPEEHNFQFVTEFYDSLVIGSWGTTKFVDIDNDGDMDLFSGSRSGGLYFYRNDGLIEDVTDYEIVQIPEQIYLYQNYPNPFNLTTKIRYDIPVNGFIELTIYNILGKKIKTLFSGFKNAGIYTTTWNGKDDNGNNVSSGIYFCKLHVDNNSSSYEKMMKIIVLK